LWAPSRRATSRCFDNGARQEIAVFERRTELPLSIALLVDTSGSTNKELLYETDSAARFLRALLSEGNPEDAVALYSFNYEVTVQQYFTHNYRSLETRLKTLHGEAGDGALRRHLPGGARPGTREGRNGDSNYHPTAAIRPVTQGCPRGARTGPACRCRHLPRGGHAHHQRLQDGITAGNTPCNSWLKHRRRPFLPQPGRGTRQAFRRDHYRTAHPVSAGLLPA